MAAVEHTLPNNNALHVSDVEVTFIIQVHPVESLTKGEVLSIGLKRCIFEKLQGPELLSM
jgi:hypothetical protein